MYSLQGTWAMIHAARAAYHAADEEVTDVIEPTKQLLHDVEALVVPPIKAVYI